VVVGGVVAERAGAEGAGELSRNASTPTTLGIRNRLPGTSSHPPFLAFLLITQHGCDSSQGFYLDGISSYHDMVSSASGQVPSRIHGKLINLVVLVGQRESTTSQISKLIKTVIFTGYLGRLVIYIFPSLVILVSS
jgi:hypothetical protein